MITDAIGQMLSTGDYFTAPRLNGHSITIYISKIIKFNCDEQGDCTSITALSIEVAWDQMPKGVTRKSIFSKFQNIIKLSEKSIPDCFKYKLI